MMRIPCLMKTKDGLWKQASVWLNNNPNIMLLNCKKNKKQTVLLLRGGKLKKQKYRYKRWHLLPQLKSIWSHTQARNSGPLLSLRVHSGAGRSSSRWHDLRWNGGQPLPEAQSPTAQCAGKPRPLQPLCSLPLHWDLQLRATRKPQGREVRRATYCTWESVPGFLLGPRWPGGKRGGCLCLPRVERLNHWGYGLYGKHRAGLGG